MIRAYLLLVAANLVPIALSYGLLPGEVLPRIASVQVEGTDQIAIYRAIMGLYLGTAAFLGISAFKADWRRVATIWAIFFLFSLAAGRILSLVLDGLPSPLFLFYLAAELLIGAVGLILLTRDARKSGNDVG